MNEFTYFTRLVEMSAGSPIERSRSKIEESEMEVNRDKDSQESDASIHGNSSQSKSSILSEESRNETIGVGVSSVYSDVMKSKDVIGNPATRAKEHPISDRLAFTNFTRNHPNQVDDDSTTSYPGENDITAHTNYTPTPGIISVREESLKHKLHSTNSKIENPASSSSQVIKKMNVEPDLQINNSRERLNDNNSYNTSDIGNTTTENIDRIIHSRIDRVPILHDQFNELHEYSSKEHLTGDDVSVSIGTIMINVSNKDREEIREPIRVNTERNDISSVNPGRLRRYSFRLR